MSASKQLFTDAALKAGIIAGTLDATAASVNNCVGPDIIIIRLAEN